MNKMVIVLIAFTLIANPMMAWTEDEKGEGKEVEITETRPFDLHVLSAVESNPFKSVSKMRKYLNRIKPINEELYEELNPMVHTLEVENTLFSISYVFLFGGSFYYWVPPYRDSSTLAWMIGTMSTGIIGVLLFKTNEEDIMKIIRRHNEILNSENESRELKLSGIKIVELKYTF